MSGLSRALVIRAQIPQIIPEVLGGWYVVKGSYGWLFGSRHEALRAARELSQEVRR